MYRTMSKTCRSQNRKQVGYDMKDDIKVISLKNRTAKGLARSHHLCSPLPPKNQVVGVALNGVLWPGDLDEAQSKLSGMDDAKFRQIFGLLYSVNKRLDLFAAYNVDRIFECRILSVDHRYRGRGLARELLERSIQTAKTSGFKVWVVTDLTNFFKYSDSPTKGRPLTISYMDDS